MECFECGSVKPLHNHHVVPRSRGGTKTVPLCYECHARVHGRSGNFDIGPLTVEALARKKAKGEFCGGRVPYGYRVGEDGVMLVVDDHEQMIIGAAIYLRSAGLSLRKVGAELERLGLMTRSGKPWIHTQIANMVAGASHD
jgi:hypothetical protein